MENDIITVYECIRDENISIDETDKTIKALKNDLEINTRKLNISSIRCHMMKALANLHEMISYIEDIKTNRTQDNYLIHQIATVRILNSYLDSRSTIYNDNSPIIGRIIYDEVVRELNPDACNRIILSKEFKVITMSAMIELLKFTPKIELPDEDKFSLVGNVYSLSPDNDVNYIKFIYNDIPGTVYTSINDKGIHSLILIYNGMCECFDSDTSIVDLLLDHPVYGKLFSHIIEKLYMA